MTLNHRCIVDTLSAQAALVAAAAAYCERHEEIVRVTVEADALPPCSKMEDVEVEPDNPHIPDVSMSCIERLSWPATYEEESHPRKWWEYRYPETEKRDAALCPECLARVNAWTTRRQLRAGIGGLKRSMLRAYRRLA